MLRQTYINRLLLFLICIFLTPAAWADPIVVEEPGDWVKLAQVVSENGEASERDPAEFLLVSDQIRLSVSEVEQFKQISLKVLTAQGVQDLSSISIEFDPRSEHILLHKVEIIRGTASIDHTRPADFSLLRREQKIDYQMYDGRQTAHLLIPGVQIGDIINYSYTLVGKKSREVPFFDAMLPLQWSVPVKRILVRVLVPEDLVLHHKFHNGGLDAALGSPILRSDSPYNEFIWQFKRVPGVGSEGDLPEWYSPAGWLHLSTAPNWQAVAAWGAELFGSRVKLDAELEQIVRRIKSENSSPAQQITAALRLVQQELRYVSLAMGDGGYIPTNPSQAWQRRFGDCKDKTLLLVTLLRKLGFRAVPALVNTEYREHISEWLPALGDFDHAIVHLTFEGREYWLDPTDTWQRGSLDKLAQPHFGMALLLSPEQTGLYAFSQQLAKNKPQIKISEHFDLRDGAPDPVPLTVTSLYTGSAADSMRAEIFSRTAAAMDREALNSYARVYPDIELVRAGQVKSDDDSNELTVTREFKIPGFWSHVDAACKCPAYWFGAFEIWSYLSDPETKSRSMPLYIEHPIVLQKDIRVSLLSKPWATAPRSVNIESKAFTFRQDSSFAGNELKISTAFETLLDAIPAEDVPDYLEKSDEVEDEIGFLLEFSLDPFAGLAKLSSSLAWLLFIVALVTLVSLGIEVSYWSAAALYRAQRRVREEDLAWSEHLLNQLQSIFSPSRAFGAVAAYRLAWPCLLTFTLLALLNSLLANGLDGLRLARVGVLALAPVGLLAELFKIWAGLILLASLVRALVRIANRYVTMLQALNIVCYASTVLLGILLLVALWLAATSSYLGAPVDLSGHPLGTVRIAVRALVFCVYACWAGLCLYGAWIAPSHAPGINRPLERYLPLWPWCGLLILLLCYLLLQ